MANLLQDLSFQTLFEAATDAMLIADSAGHIVLANSVALHLFDYTHEQITTLEIGALMSKSKEFEDYRPYDKNKKQTVNRQQSKNREFIALRRDGSELAVDFWLSPIKANDKVFILATFHIADRRRKVEEALRISEERLRLAKEAAGIGVFDFDFKANIIHWDERMRDIWGEESAKFVSYKKFVAAIHPDDRATRQSVVNHALSSSSDGEYNVEFRVINPNDGVERWVATIGRMHFSEGRATRLLGVARDITEQKTLEHTLQAQRAEMEALFKQQVAAQTASAIAHEFNQPLAAISAYSEVALHSLDDMSFDPDKLRHALESCVKQAQRAGNSLHELLAFLKEGDLIKSSFDLNNTVKEALNITKGDGYGGFNPILRLQADLPNVCANEVQVRKILVNLLRNAVEAMRALELPAASVQITVRTYQEGNMAHITIRDNGLGLDEETAKHIFEPFFTTKPTGIGMGLSISRALTEANGGQLWLEEKKQSGATFHFTLPFEQ